MPVYPGFVGPSYTHQSVNFDCQRSLNLYLEKDESGAGASPAALIGTPGLVTWCTLATAPVRAVLSAGAPLGSGARMFAVGGSKLYEISSVGVPTLLGDVGDDASHTPAQLFVNGTQLCIISAGLLYIHNGTTLSQPTYPLNTGTVSTDGAYGVTWLTGDKFDNSMLGMTITIGGTPYVVALILSDINLVLSTPGTVSAGAAYATAAGTVKATTGAFIDGYFIAQQPDSALFHISALNDGSTYPSGATRIAGWDPLDYGAKEGYPDHIGSILADHRDLWLFGESTTEVWRNTGNADFPFERDPSAFIQQGIAAPWSAVSLGQGVAWLGNTAEGNAVAWMSRGFVPQRVSTHAIENAWAGYASIRDAIAWVYEDRGHFFWFISFPTGNATWCYDVTTGTWAERGWTNGAAIDRHRGRCHAFVYGKHLVGDHTLGKIYDMSLAYYDDAGTSITRIRTAPHINSELAPLMVHAFELQMEAGTGASPVISMDYSKDGGHTWSTPRTDVIGGTTGDYTHRMIWRRLGRSRDRVFRVKIVAAVRVAIMGAYLKITQGNT